MLLPLQSLCTRASDISGIQIREHEYVGPFLLPGFPGALDAPTDGTMAASKFGILRL